MKTIDLMKDMITMNYIHPFYMDVPQPMTIYDGREEFVREMGKYKDDIKVVSTYGRLMDWLSQFDVPFSDWSGWDITKATGKMLFINTKEKFIPAKVNKHGTIVYKVDSKGEMIPIDGCFVRVYKLVRMSWQYMLYTASGVWSVSQNRFEISGGIKPQYKHPKAYSQDPYYGLTPEEKIQKLVERKKPSATDYRLFNYLFNPQSSMYLFGNEDPLKAIQEAVKLAYGSRVRKKDAPKMVFNERFSKVFMKELSKIMPGFKMMLKEHFDGNTIAEMLQKAFSKSIADGTVDDARNVIKDIITLAHGDEIMGHESEVPLIGDESPSAKQIASKSTVEPFDLTIKQATKVDVPRETKDKALKSVKSDLEEKQYNTLRQETDSISEYVDDGEVAKKDAEEFIKNTFDED